MKGVKGIAITGIGCRFPGGADGPDAFWKLLCQGVDAIGEVPADRWNAGAYYDSVPGRKGKSITRWGGFVDAIDAFDAEFFGISPREAAFVDPQQRMLLRAAWEAIEDGGQTPEMMRRTHVGVFVGISTNDYAWLQSTPKDNRAIDVWTSTGGVASIAANRISYCLDFRGPSVAVDSACSSSLVAVHLACRSLLNGECDMALAGGVNALLLPGPFISFSRGGMLSPDGRCKAFDARANGFVRAEGVGVVLLKPLSAAVACGDPIYAVILGTAMNQDGRTSGITVPNALAQTALVREACRNAGVSPRQVQYVEAHGTGTAVGDPIEAEALGTALGGAGGRAKPCVIGSVKTNIGHLEAGAGIAGLIKVALSLNHGAIPPSLHFLTPNPRIDFGHLGLRIATQIEKLPADGPAIAGVNSFGFGGTNAHAILRSPPPQAKDDGRQAVAARAHLFTISAKGVEPLRGIAKKYEDFLGPDGGGASLSLEDICFSAGTRRTHHAERLAIACNGRDDLLEKLGAYLAGDERPGLSAGRALEGPGAVFVFSGQGPQWWAMGRELLRDEPIFRTKIEECDSCFRRLGRWSLIEELSRGESDSRLQQTDIAQPAIFALQVALAALWQAWGVRPAATVGHSVGEVAAAHVAGALTLREAARVIFHRGRCMEMASERGRMLATGLSWPQAIEAVAPFADRVAAGAYNGPNSAVLSGDGPTLEAIAATLEARGIFNRLLQVNYAFHSQQMDPVRDRLLRALGPVEVRPPDICLMSTVTGDEATASDFGTDYWWQNVRQPVLFATAIEALVRRGHRTFLELSAHPVLAGPIGECMKAAGVRGTVLPSLRRKEPECATMLGSLGALHVLGNPVDFPALYPSAHVVRLPTYAWRLEHYWSEASEWRDARLAMPAHPLLADSLKTALPTWRTSIDLESFQYLNDHRVQGRVVFPAAGYVEMGLAAARVVFGPSVQVLEEIDFQRALFLPDVGEVISLELSCDPRDGGFVIAAAKEGTEAKWAVHAVGRFREDSGALGDAVSLDEVRGRCADEVSPETIYRMYLNSGLAFGPSFRGIGAAWRGSGEAVGRVGLPSGLESDAEKHLVHPALLDACFQVLSLAVAGPSGRPMPLYLPVQIARVRFYERPGTAVWCHAVLRQHGGRTLAGDIRILDDRGRVLVEIEGLRCQATTTVQPGGDMHECLYSLCWKPQALGRIANPDRFLAPVSETIDHVTALSQPGHAWCRRHSRSGDMNGEVEAICRAYFIQAMDRLGWRTGETEPFAAEDLAARLGVSERHREVFRCFLDLLVRDGGLRRGDGAYHFAGEIANADPLRAARRALEQFPAALPELSLAGLVGQGLVGVLRGEKDPPRLISEEGAMPVAEHFYQDSDTCRSWNLAMAEAVAAAIRHRPDGRVIRILEIGAGTGGATAHILPWLPRERTDYIFTDLSEHAFRFGEQKFFEFPFVRYRRLDIDRPPAEQGFEEQSIDVVIAANVLYATTDLVRSLQHIRTLLAPGGLLLLREFLRPTWLGDLVLGFAEGWRNRDGDGHVPDGCDAARWRQLLRAGGYTDVSLVSPGAHDLGSSQIMLLGRAPATSEARDGTGPPAAAQREMAGTWLLFDDANGLGGIAGGMLAERGATIVTVRAGAGFAKVHDDAFEMRPGSPDDMRLLISAIVGRAGPPLGGIVHFWSLDAKPPDERGGMGLTSAEEISCHSVVHLLQALGQEATQDRPALWLITRGAQALGPEDPVNVAQAPVWGLGRVISNELPAFRCRMVDLSPAPAEDEIAALILEIERDGPENEVALRGADRYVQRLVRSTVGEGSCPPGRLGGERGFRLESEAPGALDRLAFHIRPRKVPGDGEVEVEVRAAALNFRDVMKALGIYPIEGDDDLLLGDECAGRIVAIGPGVERWAVGDDVLMIGSGCFGSHITVPEARLARMPERLGFDEAAAIPVAFLTAWYALHHLARIRAGDRVLIHAATGGVGLAAVQIAQLAGAEVLATAGSPWKREFLRALGVKDVMDSRSLAFADEVREITGGRGVDIVLNSLAGEAIAKGVGCLAPGGRFLEIGKRDVYQNARLGLRPFRHNVSFFVIDLARLIRDDPPLIAGLLDQILSLFGNGDLHPLPVRTFDASLAGQAFRHMSQARHIGKIVLSMEPRGITMRAGEDARPARFRADATYVITGGLGGFGLALAEWMFKGGARHLVLAGRSGASTEAAARTVEALRERGCDVLVAQSDVTNAEDMASLFAKIAQDMPRVRGIIHAAMVMDDCTIARQTSSRFGRVMAPKTAGAWNLHVVSRDLPLDFFVLFSSFSSMAGNPGQCSYAAANCFLDALAHHRRARGLPALVVNWGPLGDVGYIARHADLEAALRAQGLSSLAPDDALDTLGRLVNAGAAQVGVVKIDWQRIAGTMRSVLNLPRYEEVRSGTTGEVAADGKTIIESILDLPEAKRHPALADALKEQVAKVLRIPAARLDMQRPLNTLGFDSLMSVELANRIEGHFGIVLPPGKLTAATSTSALAGELLGLMTQSSSPGAPPKGPFGTAEIDGRAAPSPATAEDPGGSAVVAVPKAPAMGRDGLVAEEGFSPIATPGGRWRGTLHKGQFFLEWLVLRWGITYLRCGDYAAACRRMRRLARWARPLLKFNWLWAQQNLRLIFGPNLTAAQRRRLATIAFENHFISYLEGLRHRDVAFDIRGGGNLLNALAAGKGVILCGAHVGSWEPALSLGARQGVPVAVVYRPAQNPWSDRLFQKIRASYEVTWIASADVGAAFEALRSNKVLGLMTDLNVTRGGTVADFLGVPARCPSGPARLALMQQSPIVPAVAIRSSDGPLQVHFEPAIVPPKNEDTEEQVRAITRRINAALEPWVVEYAEQYNWLHPRWRCRPDGRQIALGASDEMLVAERTAPFLDVPDRVRALL